MVGNNKDKKTTRETFGSIDPATGEGQAKIVLIIFGVFVGIFILIALLRFLNSDVDR